MAFGHTFDDVSNNFLLDCLSRLCFEGRQMFPIGPQVAP